MRGEAEILEACRVSRPGAKLVQRRTADGTLTLAVWKVDRDLLIDPDCVPPASSRWRAQVVSEVTSAGVWWWGVEGHGSTKERAIADALL